MTTIHRVSKLNIWALALCHHLRNSFGGLSQLPGQHEDVRLTGPQDLSTGTVQEGASPAAALPARAWGSYSPALIWRPKATVLTHPWQILHRCLLLEETQRKKAKVESVPKKLKIIFKNQKNQPPSQNKKNPNPFAPSTFTCLSIYRNGNNNIEIIYQKV